MAIATVWLVAAGAVVGVHAQTVSTYAGGGVGDNTTAAKANMTPGSIAFGPDGGLFIADGVRVRKIGTDGIIRTVAGGADVDSGETVGFRPIPIGDGGPATAVPLAPGAIAVDAAGNLYISDSNTKRIRKVTPAGIISTVVGTGVAGFSGDGGAGTEATINYPGRLAFDASGNLFFGDTGNHRIRKLAPSGIVSTVVGNGTSGFSGDGGLATNASISSPLGLAVDSAGNLYFFDGSNLRVRKVTIAGVIGTIAGSGNEGATGDSGTPALNAKFRASFDLAVDRGGNVYVAERYNNLIRRITPGGQIYRFAGNNLGPAFGGDGGLATAATAGLAGPGPMSFGPGGTMYFSDGDNFRIRTITTGGILNSLYGNGTNTYNGDGGNARDAIFGLPRGNAVDAQGNVFVADILRNRIRKITPAGLITTVAGNGQEGFSGDGGPAIAANLYFPNAVAVDAAGNLYISDNRNQRIRKVTTDGRIDTIAGNGDYGFSGDGGPARSASLLEPYGVAVDPAGNVYIADNRNFRIRKVTPAGIITTIAGKNRPPGDNPYTGIGGPAVDAFIGFPTAIHVDPLGQVYFAADGRLYKLSPSGQLIAIAGDQSTPSENQTSVTEADAHLVAVSDVTGIARDTLGNTYLSADNTVRVITAGGVINQFAGVFDYGDSFDNHGFSGDGGAAIGAKFFGAAGVSVDAAGNVFVSDTSNGRIRRVVRSAVPVEPSIPGQARDVVATPSSGMVTVSFLPPRPLGGLTLPVYGVRSIPDGGIDLDAGTGKVVHRIIGLVPGQTYRFVVRAWNQAGIGADSEPTLALAALQSNPTVSISDGALLEGGASGLAEMEFVVSLSHPSTESVIVTVTPTGLTASSGVDFYAFVREMQLFAGQTQAIYRLPIRGDTTVEPDETVAATITSVAGATIGRGQAIGTIINDDGEIPVLSLADASAVEGDIGGSSLVFTVSLSSPAGADGAAFQATTSDSSSGTGSATAGRDYYPLAASVFRIAPGASMGTFAVKIAGDTLPEADEVFDISLGELRGATAGRVTGIGTIHDDDGAPTVQGKPSPPTAPTKGPMREPTIEPTIGRTTIAAVQGRSATSPWLGREVTVQGVVTALSRRGFYLQSADEERDADPLTSDALFVATGKMPGGVIAVGQLLLVRGRVEEAATGASPALPTMTQLAYADANLVAPHALPQPVHLTVPAMSAQTIDYEAFEGMRVTIPASVVVGPVQGRVIDELSVAQGNGLFHVVAQGAPRPLLLASESTPMALPLRVASAGQVGTRAIAVDVGDRLPALTGVLHQAGDTYELRLDPVGKIQVSPGAQPRPVAASDALRFAQFTLRRMFDDRDDPARAEPVLGRAAYALRLAKIANAICAYLRDPDVLVVNEVENSDVLDDLAEAINSRAGNLLFPGACGDDPGYRAHMVEGSDPDGLRTGVLIRSAPADAEPRVSLRSLIALPMTSARGSNAGLDAAAFVAQLDIRADDGRPETLALLGYRAWGSDDDAARAARTRQWARFQTDVAHRIARAPLEPLVLLADAGVATTDALGALDEPARRLPAGQRYDAVVDGRAIALSRAGVSPAIKLAGYRATLDHARINADFGEDNLGDFAVPVRVSDRDPLVLTLERTSAPVSQRCAKTAGRACMDVGP